MATSSIKAIIKCDIAKVWETVLTVEKYQWRSDLSKTVVINEKQFIEYTKKRYPGNKGYTDRIWTNGNHHL